jgi:hypothetical protein
MMQWSHSRIHVVRLHHQSYYIDNHTTKQTTSRTQQNAESQTCALFDALGAPPHPKVGHETLMLWPGGPPWPGTPKSNKHRHTTPISQQRARGLNITDAPVQVLPHPTPCANLPTTIILSDPTQIYYTLQTILPAWSKDATTSIVFETPPQKHTQNIVKTYSNHTQHIVTQKKTSQQDTQRELLHTTYDQKILHERTDTRRDDTG